MTQESEGSSVLERFTSRWYKKVMSVEEMAMQLPRADKLRLMEALWSDLSRSEGEFESPSWHESALRETEQRLASGEEKSADWEDAKRRLRGN